GRARERVVVVVQFLATDPHAPRGEVGGLVGGFEVAVAPPVTDTVDHTSGPDRNPKHLHGPDCHAEHAEQGEADHRHQGRAEHRVLGVNVALHPVVRRAAAILLYILGIRGGGTVQFYAFEEHFADTLDLRT